MKSLLYLGDLNLVSASSAPKELAFASFRCTPDGRAGRVAEPARGEAQEAGAVAVGRGAPGPAGSGPRMAPLHAVTAIAIVACGRAWEGRRKGGRGLRQVGNRRL